MPLFHIFAIWTLVIVVGASQALTAAPNDPASDRELADITAAHIAELSDSEVLKFFVSRMSNPGPGEPSSPLIDAEIVRRPSSRQILSAMLQQPANRSIRFGLWDWLSKNPGFAGTNDLLIESIALYRSEGEKWEWDSRSAFASLLAVAGNQTVVPILDELVLRGGPGVQAAKDRFLKRMSGSATESVVRGAYPADHQAMMPLPPKEPPNTAASKTNETPLSMPWVIVVVMIAGGAGLLWLVLKRRAK